MENMPQTESARQCSSVHGALTLKKEKVPSFRMSIIFIGISVCSISLGIIMIVYKDQDRDELNFAAKTGSPIWSGSMLLLSGIFCFVVSGKDVSYRDVASDGYYNGMVAYGIINVLSLFINIGAVLLCTLTVIISRGQVLNIFALIISILMFDCNIVGCMLCCRKYDKPSHVGRVEHIFYNERPMELDLKPHFDDRSLGLHVNVLNNTSLPRGFETPEDGLTLPTDSPPAYNYI